MAKYEKDLHAYETKVAGGKYKKAFVVQGDEKGKYVYVTMNSKKSTSGKKDVKAKEAAGELTLTDIEDEIKRIQDREKRSKELDAEKVHKRVIDAVKADESMNNVPAEASPTDTVLIRFLLSELINYTNRKLISKRIGLTDSVWGNKDAAKYHKQLEELTHQQITFLVRQIMLDKHTGTTAEHGTGYMFRLMAESLGTIPIEAFETEQREIAERRHARVNKRLAELKAKKAELKKAQPKADADSKPKAKAKKKK